MSTLPGNMPPSTDDSGDRKPVEHPLLEQASPAEGDGEPGRQASLDTPTALDVPTTDGYETTSLPGASAPLADYPPRPELFVSYSRPEYIPEARIPNFGHLLLLLLMFSLGYLGAGSILLIGLHFHVFGLSNLAQASNDFRYTIGSQAIQYFITFAGCLTIFPAVWHKSFLTGLHWRWAAAFRYRRRLISAVVLCFVGAIVNMLILPGPPDAPIDKLFRSPGAAWVLFAFGITLAPFFEELVFRGFLLPALCTAYDWMAEQIQGTPRRPLNEEGDPRWSLPAMLAGSLVTSLPFALMHGEQTAWSIGPFSLLICVSMVLCWVRLGTRSLAASTIVHAGYNFMLFSLMVFGTDGFRHLDKM